MIQFPVNVQPHNKTIAVSKEKHSDGRYFHIKDFNFEFHGGFSLGRVEFSLFNLNTGTQLLDRVQVYTQTGEKYSKVFSGDTVEFSNTNEISDKCENGFNYAYNMILYQYDRNDNPIYDMFTMRGKIGKIQPERTEIQLEKGITSIIPDSCIMYIGAESRLITGYNSETGIAAVQNAFSSELSEGLQFKIYSNYIITPNYYFQCRSIPELSVSMTREYGQVRCSAEYSQAQNTALKYYTYSLWQTDNLAKWINGRTPSSYAGFENLIDTRHYLIGTGYSDIVNKSIYFDAGHVIADDDNTTYVPDISGVSYSSIIAAYDTETGIITLFPLPSSFPISKYIPEPDTRFTITDRNIPFIKKTEPRYTNNMNYLFNIDASGHSYRLKCDVVTQDNVTVSAISEISFNQADESLINSVTKIYFQSDTNSVCLEWDNNGLWEYNAPCLIFRKDNDDISYKLAGIAMHSDTCFIDYSAANTKTYEYMIMPCKSLNESNKSLYYRTVRSSPLTVNFEGWTITSITENHTDNVTFDQYRKVLGDDVKIYSVGETWNLYANIENPTISQNLNKTVQTGLSKYPSVARGGNNYLSGSFSGFLGNFECQDESYTDNIYLVEKWRKFISADTQFLIRTDKGDVICAETSYSSAPSTVYDESTEQLATKIQFDFIEFDDVDNIVFVKTDNDAGIGTEIYSEDKYGII